MKLFSGSQTVRELEADSVCPYALLPYCDHLNTPLNPTKTPNKLHLNPPYQVKPFSDSQRCKRSESWSRKLEGGSVYLECGLWFVEMFWMKASLASPDGMVVVMWWWWCGDIDGGGVVGGGVGGGSGDIDGDGVGVGV